MFASSDVVTMPMLWNICEKYSKVAVEAVLRHCPVIFGAAFPVDDIRSAAKDVSVDEVMPYADAILALYRDSVEYRRLVDATDQVRELYLDSGAGIGDALIRFVARTGTVRPPLADARQARIIAVLPRPGHLV